MINSESSLQSSPASQSSPNLTSSGISPATSTENPDKLSGGILPNVPLADMTFDKLLLSNPLPFPPRTNSTTETSVTNQESIAEISGGISSSGQVFSTGEVSNDSGKVQSSTKEIPPPVPVEAKVHTEVSNEDSTMVNTDSKVATVIDAKTSSSSLSVETTVNVKDIAVPKSKWTPKK